MWYSHSWAEQKASVGWYDPFPRVFLATACGGGSFFLLRLVPCAHNSELWRKQNLWLTGGSTEGFWKKGALGLPTSGETSPSDRHTCFL